MTHKITLKRSGVVLGLFVGAIVSPALPISSAQAQNGTCEYRYTPDVYDTFGSFTDAWARTCYDRITGVIASVQLDWDENFDPDEYYVYHSDWATQIFEDYGYYGVYVVTVCELYATPTYGPCWAVTIGVGGFTYDDPYSSYWLLQGSMTMDSEYIPVYGL